MDSIPKPHLLAVPFPVPGHVNPLLNLCYRMAAEGIRVTFVTTDSKHSRTVEEEVGLPLKFVSFPDGVENETGSMKRVLMPDYLLELIERMNLAEENEPITAVLADATVGWVHEVAERIGAQQFAFWNAAPRGLAYLLSSLPELNQESAVVEKIQVNDQSSWMVWVEKMMANMGIDTMKRIRDAKSILINAFYDLDSSSCQLIPRILPVGPLKSISDSNSSIISQEDASCLEWLNRQPNNSVVYVAFGGTGVMSQCQFEELAIGLELAGQPFLWVVRPNLVNGTSVQYPEGYMNRVADNNNGKILDWAPQEKVLAHPATACFLSHCGWNSILEGISYGVPFLCWPHSGEQFFHQDYVSEILKVGIKLDVDHENGIRSRKEISNKIQMLLSNSSMKASALKLKILSEQSISKKGSSNQNLQSFINQLKQ